MPPKRSSSARPAGPRVRRWRCRPRLRDPRAARTFRRSGAGSAVNGFPGHAISARYGSMRRAPSSPRPASCRFDSVVALKNDHCDRLRREMCVANDRTRVVGDHSTRPANSESASSSARNVSTSRRGGLERRTWPPLTVASISADRARPPTVRRLSSAGRPLKLKRRDSARGHLEAADRQMSCPP